MGQEERLVEDNLPPMPQRQMIASDNQLLYSSDTTNLSEHNKQYTRLLKAYVDNFEKSFKEKQEAKKKLLWIAIALLVGIPVCTMIITCATLYCMVRGEATALEVWPGLLVASGALIGTYMVIPKMVTGYLFHTQEECHLAEIISKIQDYDKEIRGKR